MSRRFFVSPPIKSDQVTLSGPQAHHLVTVLRARPGTEVVLFDGTGVEFDARVLKVERGQVRLQLLERREEDRELPFSLTLAVALPKGDRQRWLVEKAVELGVGHLVPLAAARAVARPTEKALERLRRVVIEASKQCGRNRLMQLEQPQTVAELVAALPAETAGVVLHPAAAPLSSKKLPDGPVAVLVGPEGGLTDEELQQATAGGWQTASLGPRTLRVETAAVAAVSWLVLDRAAS